MCETAANALIWFESSCLEKKPSLLLTKLLVTGASLGKGGGGVGLGEELCEVAHHWSDAEFFVSSLSSASFSSTPH